jgi:hypothetical protein
MASNKTEKRVKVLIFLSTTNKYIYIFFFLRLKFACASFKRCSRKGKVNVEKEKSN